ncbi:hypothetical protein GmHk_08G023424 [Glycine max]|nr:hypothetical protein GmHk_08G023424 [Glycine max]
MVIILPKEHLVVWFCSLHNKPDNYLKGIINIALKGLDDAPQPKSKTPARWIVVKCNRQKGSTECGYYVMHWMSTIILGNFRNNWEAYFNDPRPLKPERLKALRIQWAQYYLRGAVGLAKPAYRPDHEVDDPLCLMTLTIPQLFLKPLQVMWDATLFGLFNENFPLYIKHEDLSEIAHGGQCLNISVIQLWILHMTETSMRAGNIDVCGFLEPQSIQRSGQSQFESENNYLKGIINSVLKRLDDTQQSKSKPPARWIVIKCNRKKGSTECGYYVMH